MKEVKNKNSIEMKNMKPQKILTALKKEEKERILQYCIVWSVANVARMNVKHFKWTCV